MLEDASTHGTREHIILSSIVSSKMSYFASLAQLLIENIYVCKKY
jgi:hypothetical protein